MQFRPLHDRVVVRRIEEDERTPGGLTRLRRSRSKARSSRRDETIGKMIAEAMQKVGNEGVITVEEAKRLESELEVVEGQIEDTTSSRLSGLASEGAAFFFSERPGRANSFNVYRITSNEIGRLPRRPSAREATTLTDVRYWHEADMLEGACDVSY